MTNTLSSVSCKNYNLNANEGFVMFLTSKLPTCFINIFNCLFTRRKEHIYWILDLDNEVHSIWVIWTSGLQESKGQAKVGASQGRAFSVMPLHCKVEQPRANKLHVKNVENVNYVHKASQKRVKILSIFFS